VNVLRFRYLRILDQVPTEWVKIRLQLAKSTQVRVSKAFRTSRKRIHNPT
jgi:hypothetical protein